MKKNGIYRRLLSVLLYPLWFLVALGLLCFFGVTTPVITWVMRVVGYVVFDNPRALFPLTGPRTFQCQECREVLPEMHQIWTRDHHRETGHKEFRRVYTLGSFRPTEWVVDLTRDWAKRHRGRRHSQVDPW